MRAIGSRMFAPAETDTRVADRDALHVVDGQSCLLVLGVSDEATAFVLWDGNMLDAPELAENVLQFLLSCAVGETTDKDGGIGRMLNWDREGRNRRIDDIQLRAKSWTRTIEVRVLHRAAWIVCGPEARIGECWTAQVLAVVLIIMTGRLLQLRVHCLWLRLRLHLSLLQ